MTRVILLFLMSSSLVVSAQSFFGFNNDNYAGVNSVFNNPSSIADSRFKTDINLVSLSGALANNFYSIKISDLLKNTNKVDEVAKFTPKSSNSFYSNSEIVGPSFMMNITPTRSIALTTRARITSHLTNLDGNLLNNYYEEANGSFSSLNQNYSIASNSWVEYGATYAQVVFNTDEHFLKGGITAKYISGIATGFAKAENLNVQFIDNFGTNDGTFTTSGSITTGNLNNIDDYNNPIQNRGSGLGIDLGATYEYRPEAINNSKKSKNKYLYKVGFSITDIGYISYKDATQRTFDANATFSESQNSNSNFDTYYTLTETSNKIIVTLPAAVRTTIDWKMHNKFYLNLNSELSLVKNTKENSAYIANNLSVTPRLETRWFSAYLPVSYIKYSGFQAGFGFRAGPLFVGSGSVISGFLGRTRAIDVNVGLKVPIYQGKKF